MISFHNMCRANLEHAHDEAGPDKVACPGVARRALGDNDDVCDSHYENC